MKSRTSKAAPRAPRHAIGAVVCPWTRRVRRHDQSRALTQVRPPGGSWSCQWWRCCVCPSVSTSGEWCGESGLAPPKKFRFPGLGLSHCWRSTCPMRNRCCHICGVGPSRCWWRACPGMRSNLSGSPPSLAESPPSIYLPLRLPFRGVSFQLPESQVLHRSCWVVGPPVQPLDVGACDGAGL